MATKTFAGLPAGVTTAAGDEVFPLWQSAATKKLTRAQLLTLLGLSPWAGTLYEEGAWTPAPTFATPGDLVVSGSTLVGRYRRIGNSVRVTCEGYFTPTWTTASGNFQMAGLPFVGVSGQNGGGPVITHNNRFTYVGELAARIAGATAYVLLQDNAPGAPTASLTAAGLSSGNSHSITFSAEYWIAA